jgi:hypothetical protein
MLKKALIYTCLFGGYDRIKEPSEDPDADYVCITDSPSLPTSKFATIPFVNPGYSTQNPRRLSRIPKIDPFSMGLPLDQYQAIIYIDASMKMARPISGLVDLLGENSDIALCAHPYDRCVFEHINRCQKLRLDDPRILMSLRERYQTEEVPKKMGLTENALIVRRVTDRQKALSVLWLKEYMAGSQRDQLSLPYCLWKMGITPTILPFTLRSNTFFKSWGVHLKSREWTTETAL